ncbi:CBS domain-containing protein [Candidatus Halobonum tyrrellensis]|uniref:Cbs domain-containing protein n=1 Tax=Candidatus Halobonum tyrrellensis G22 TaxID=1324957 RepID=V4J296_9EURY|nr:CBS domain-containing protein [Candidatus Halobonum tyrrellensis]ESP89537.1 cbs domain-containing protein [Candidatus Halobonum tyrrellensis G22]
MNVVDAMTPRADLVTVSLPGGRDDVLAYLQEHRFSSVPVVKGEGDDETYRGLVSRDDLIEQPDEDQLAILMREVATVTPDTHLRDAAQIMLGEGTRRIPVVEAENGDRLAGIITVTDVIDAIAHGKVEVDATCGDVAGDEVNTVYVGTPLTVTERQLYFARVPYAIALDEEGMAGMVTEVDIVDVARVVEGADDTGDSIADEDDDWKWEGIKGVGSAYIPTRNVEIPVEPVSEFMTEEVVTVSKTRSVTEVAQEMISNDIEQVPLVTGGDVAGIVRDVHVVAAL